MPIPAFLFELSRKIRYSGRFDRLADFFTLFFTALAAKNSKPDEKQTKKSLIMSPDNEHRIAIYQWHQLIQQSCDFAGIELSPEIQSYLLLTLVRYIQNDDLANEAITFSQKLRDDLPFDPRLDVLKGQADHCLILSGLFPSHIHQQQQRISHYIQHGVIRYTRLAARSFDADKQIYQKLSDDFISLVDVLYTLRQFNGSPALPLIQAMELWSDTGSAMAYRTLTMNRRSIPLNERLMAGHLIH